MRCPFICLKRFTCNGWQRAPHLETYPNEHVFCMFVLFLLDWSYIEHAGTSHHSLRKIGANLHGKISNSWSWPAWLLSTLTAASGSFGYAAQLAWAIRRAGSEIIGICIILENKLYTRHIYIYMCAFVYVCVTGAHSTWSFPKTHRLSHSLHSFLIRETHWVWSFLMRQNQPNKKKSKSK